MVKCRSARSPWPTTVTVLIGRECIQVITDSFARRIMRPILMDKLGTLQAEAANVQALAGLEQIDALKERVREANEKAEAARRDLEGHRRRRKDVRSPEPLAHSDSGVWRELRHAFDLFDVEKGPFDEHTD